MTRAGAWTVRSEDGHGLITAMLAALVVVVLGGTIATVSVHDSSRSSYDRRRVQSIAAANAGLDYYFSHLQNATAGTLECSKTTTLSTSPSSSFTATLHDANGNAIQCPAVSVPSTVLVRSVGAATADAPARTMEALIELAPIVGGTLGDTAIFADEELRFDSNNTVLGNVGNDAHVYTNANSYQLSNVVISGSVFSQGTITIDSNAEVKLDAWAKGSVLMDGNAIVRQNVTSSTSTVTLKSNAHVYRDAKAAGAVSVESNAAVDGLKIQNTPSAAPPVRVFPAFTFNAAAFQADGFTVTTFTSCSAAKTFIGAIVAGKHAVRVASSCELSWGSSSVVSVKDDLAIVADGNVKLDSNAAFTPVGGPHDVLVITKYGQTAAACSGNGIELNSNSRIGPGLNTLLYTPCSVYLDSNASVVRGQVFGGGSVLVKSNASLTFVPMYVPGTTTVGFDENVLYRREVVTQ